MDQKKPNDDEVPEFQLTQVFGGDKTVLSDQSDVDIVNTLEFDETGNYLAAGDKGGRVVLFEVDNPKDEKRKRSRIGYRFLMEFQSHEQEFDCLKSVEIEEKINQIRFLKHQNPSINLVSTNDKTIKLWRVHEKKSFSFDRVNSSSNRYFPTLKSVNQTLTASLRKTFSGGHTYHVHSISVNCDQENFLSADDLRINLWNLNVESNSFNIVDIKPSNMDDLSEVITSACFHPFKCNEMLYATSKGTVKLVDMREKALCDSNIKKYQSNEDANTGFFADIVASVSDVKFSDDGKYILARDYLTLKLWDVAMDNMPVRVLNVQEHLNPRLSDVYENDCIYDKFEASFNHDSTKIVTGSYSRQFSVFDLSRDTEIPLVASKTVKPLSQKNMKKTKTSSSEFFEKALHLTFHPTIDLIAIALHNNLYIFNPVVPRPRLKSEY